MRRLMLFVLVAVLATVPAALVSRSAAAQGTPEPLADQLANCQPGRPEERTGNEPATLGELPTDPGEDSTAPWALDQFGYFSWEGVCRPIPEVGEQVPPELLERLQQIADAELPEEFEALREELTAALDGSSGFVLQPYAVGFKKEYAATRPIGFDEVDENVAELMVVAVRQGTFVLDLYADEQDVAGQVVVSSTESVEIEPSAEWDFGTEKPHYVVESNVLDCTTTCPVSPEQPVQLEPGDFAITQSGTLCLYCLAQEAAANGVLGFLEVYALVNPEDLESFSWIQSWELPGQSVSANGAQEGAQILDSPTMFGWAFPNLKTGCKDG